MAALRLYHARLNVRDREYEYEYDRGIIQIGRLFYLFVGCQLHRRFICRTDASDSGAAVRRSSSALSRRSHRPSTTGKRTADD